MARERRKLNNAKVFEVSYHFTKKKALMHNITAVLAVLAAVSVGMAQSVNISGKVTTTAGVGIAGAVVKLEKGGQTATTGANGNFTLTGVATGITGHSNQTLPHNLSATIHNGLLCVNIAEKSALEITAFDLNGKTLSTVLQTLDAGTHFIAMTQWRAGIHLYKVKSRGSEFVIKSNSIGGVSGGTAVSVQGPSSGALAKQAKTAAAINDVIAVTTAGYLDYRMIITNSDTSGIQISMLPNAGNVKDTDGNVYQSVKIGNQVWTVSNLRTTKFNDGTAIPLVTDNAAWTALTTPGYCWNNNNIANKSTYGALYNWYTVNTGKLAPAGWHVPTDAEWTTLATYLGGVSAAGGKLKEAGLAHWQTPNTGATNETGFSALPGGYRPTNGAFYTIGTFAPWWSSTANDATSSWFHYVYYQGADVVRKIDNKTYGYSVRCLRDN